VSISDDAAQYRMPLLTSVPFFINAPQFGAFDALCTSLIMPL
jgi:hypothetical protein